MTDLTKSLPFALALALVSAAAAAQETAPETPAEEAPAEAPAETPVQPAPTAEGLSMGEPEAQDGPGSQYVQSTHGAWELRCVRTEDGSDPCQLYQLLKDQAGNSVAEISLFALPAGQEAAAGATIVTPLETLLTQQVTLQVDSAQPKRYPFTFCAPIGCIARVGFTQAEVDSFKKGNRVALSVVPAAAPDQKVELAISLQGFTAGFDAVAAANAQQE